VLSSGEFFLVCLQGTVVTCFEFVDAPLVDVEPDNRAFAAKLNGQWETNIAQANYGQLDIL